MDVLIFHKGFVKIVMDIKRKGKKIRISKLTYFKKPGSMQKESVQSNHPAWRKRPKCAEILGYFDVGQKHQNLTTF
jgi:hypothetical protein